MATSDDGSNLCGAADQLASEGFVLLHQLCNSELVELVLDVSRRRAHTVREALGAKEIGIGSAAGYVGNPRIERVFYDGETADATQGHINET